MALSSDLRDFPQWIEHIIESLDETNQQRLFSQIARNLRASNRRRITAQTNPDGTPFAPRQIREKALTSHIRNRGNRNPHPQRGNPALSFSYKGKRVELKSYREEGPMLIGFDRVSKQVKAYKKANIGKPKPKRNNKMFRKIRQDRHLKIRSWASGSRVYFNASDSRIARIHQFGLRDYKTGGKYPGRELLGINEQDKELIQETIMKFLDRVMNTR